MTRPSIGTRDVSITTAPAAYRSKPLQPHVDDSYKLRGKPQSPAACTDCGAVFAHGRWSWATRPQNASSLICPACQRIRDVQPAGYLVIDGEFLDLHRDDVLHLLRNVEAREKAEHPLQRIMQILDDGATLQISTTDAHLARGLGDALHRAYRGRLESRYAAGENLVRVTWQR